MNYILAGAILLVWLFLITFMIWDPKASTLINIWGGLFVFVITGVVYALPFWLIFLKS